MRTLSTLLVAATAPLVLGSLALAQPTSQPASQPTSQPAAAVNLKVSASVPEAVTLGEDLVVSVKVENAGEQPVALRTIRLSSHSTYVEVSGRRWKRPYGILRFPGGIPNLKPGAQESLAPGKSIQGTLTFPTVETGKFKLRVGFTGHVPFPLPKGLKVTPFFSPMLNTDVRPTKEGAVRYQVLMKTNHGEVTMTLDDEVAPCTVRNFVTLIRQGFYKGLTFHRVIRNFMIQGGDPDGNGQGGPGYSIPAEFSRVRRHKPGALAMARTNHPHTAGSQFYICLGAPTHLDGQYTLFGQVVAGQDVIDKIGALPTAGADVPKQKVVIESMTLVPVDSEGKPAAPSAKEAAPGEEPKAE